MNQPTSPPSLQFDVDSIRALAQLLRESELGEICIETTSENQPPSRLLLRRAAAAPAQMATSAPAADAPPAAWSTPEEKSVEKAAKPKNIEITSLAVGVFREAKTPVQVGDEIKARQVLGSVESLRVPNEIASPVAGKVLEISTADGQGVEYGQVLFVVEEA